MVVLKAIEFAKHLVGATLGPGGSAVDATAGNGNDTLLLARIVGREGRVYAFDIQREALNITRSKLVNENLADHVLLINDGHENMDKHVSGRLDAVMFNLGYLPGGNHNLVTRPASTLKAVDISLRLINRGGIITIVSYSGHPGGMEEREQLAGMLENLDQKQYQVLHYSIINQKNHPPRLFAIQKL
ncbi:MAG: methyltransferase domain-containing protein [Firmicutes bacterium]|nr:methyltransferase domain-containing protein [Bacillota bacterium]